MKCTIKNEFKKYIYIKKKIKQELHYYYYYFIFLLYKRTVSCSFICIHSLQDLHRHARRPAFSQTLYRIFFSYIFLKFHHSSLHNTSSSINSMASNPRKQATSLPPKRGQIKAQIFESLVETVTSKAEQVLAKIKGGGGSVNGGATSDPSSSPLTAYTSDGSPDQA